MLPFVPNVTALIQTGYRKTVLVRVGSSAISFFASLICDAGINAIFVCLVALALHSPLGVRFCEFGDDEMREIGVET